MTIKHGLGRGLASLISAKPLLEAKSDSDAFLDSKESVETAQKEGGLIFVSPQLISANPYQPRTTFEQEKLDELVASIKIHGILTPLIAKSKGDGSYELISGERRLRAARDVGLATVPIIVCAVNSQEQFEISLIENIQREDLNPIELGEAYQELMASFSLTQEDLSQKLGKSRPHIAHMVRLLKLPDLIKASLQSGEIFEGHAKVILSIEETEGQLALWKRITLNRLTVRRAEREARYIKVKSHARKIKERDRDIIALEEKLEEKIGTKVLVKGNAARGQIIIDYFSKEELERIVEGF